jgi:hypothetical protein
MTAASKYWKLVRLDAKGRRKVEEIVSAKAFYQQQFPELAPQIDVPDAVIQRQLLALLRQASEVPVDEATSYLNAERCLRCFISSQIEQVCLQLEFQFGSDRGFTRYDLFPFVLDDTLNNLRGTRSQVSSGSNPTTYTPMAIKILQTFEPDRASLSTWTARLVKHHRELNAFLLEHGVYLVSDWAILNDTTAKQLQRILAEFHNFTSVEIEQSSLLLESYHAVYRRERLKLRSSGVRGKCQPPSREQLKQIGHLLGQKAKLTLEAAGILGQLQKLAEYLRQYRIYARGGFSPPESLDNLDIRLKVEQQQVSQSNGDPEAEEEQAEFLGRYRQEFLHCLERAIAQAIRARLSYFQGKNPQKAQQFLTALELFHCQGRSMGEIAPQIGLQAQYQVTRFLKLKEFRSDIRQLMLKDLPALILGMAAKYTDPDLLLQREQQIEAALNERVDALMQKAETEVSLAERRSPSSLFAQHLCRYLALREESP